jgi:curved DNA-binding protein CbpA
VENGSSDLGALGIKIDEGKSASEILGLVPNASRAEIREAYIRLAKKYHPDTHPGDLVAERRFKRITKAYDELRSPFNVMGGAHTYRAPGFWGAYRQALAIAVMFFVLTPLAMFLAMRNEERSVPSLELRQAEVAASGEIGDAGGTVPVKEIAIIRGSAPSAPQERTTALKMDGLVRSRPLLLENNSAAEAPRSSYKRSFDISAGGISAARLSEEFVKDGRFRGSEPFEAQPSQGVDEAHSSLETTPQWQARGPGLQARSPNDEIAVAPANDTVQPKDQNGQKKVASVQQGYRIFRL